MSDEQIDEFGAGLGLLDKLRLMTEWAPLVGRLQTITSAKSAHERAIAIVSAAQWAAGKSPTTIDDEALAHVEAVLKTDEGKAAFDWLLGKLFGAT